MQRSERGASSIEVALILTLIAMVVFGAVKLMGAKSEVGLADVGDTIDEVEVADPGGGGGGGGGGGDPISVTSTTAPITAPPPTDPPTTVPWTMVPSTTSPPPPSTTAAPTTTTTTTTPQGTEASGRLRGLDARNVSSTRWRASTTLTLVDDLGNPLAGVTVQIRQRLRTESNGSTSDQNTFFTVTTDANGVAEIDVGDFDNYGSTQDIRVHLRIQSMDLPSHLEWDGSRSGRATYAPSR